MIIKIPYHSQQIISLIKAQGASCYLVGGAVRDMLMNKEPQDFDLATSLEPNMLKALFAQAVDIGGKYGTIRLAQAEITPFRAEGAYTDSRHPSSVHFGVGILSDLARRDFTINAIAYDGEVLIDPYGGQADIKARILRCVGDAHERFDEDALRILRLYRFAAVTGFDIDEKTACAAAECANNISYLPFERVRGEMQKLLTAAYPASIEPLIACGALKSYSLTSSSRSLSPLDKVPPQMLARWWALCALCDANADAVCTAFGFAGAFARDIKALNSLWRGTIAPSKEGVKTALSAMPDIDLDTALCAIAAIDSSFVHIYKIYCEICQKREVFRLSELAINGNDLKAIGVSGRKIADILHELLMYVIKNPAGNKRSALIKLANYLKCLL